MNRRLSRPPTLVDPAAALNELDSLPTSGRPVGFIYRRLQELKLGDGLPVGLPSPALIDEMLGRAGVDPDHVILQMPPLRGPLTARRLAVCAALAGCEASHLRVLIPALSSFTRPELNAYGFLTTTGNAAPLLLINGPARLELDFNHGANCLGPGNRSNATVGRCVSLVMRIVGGAREGIADMATMGQPAKYTFCFGENEEASPWQPFSTDRGFARSQSAVTVMSIAGTIETFGADSGLAKEMLAVLASTLATSAPVMAAGEHRIGGGQPIVVMSPEWAVQLAKAGMTKLEVQRQLFHLATRDMPDSTLQVAAVPEDILIVIAGGAGIKQTVIPNWNGGARAVTAAIAPE